MACSLLSPSTMRHQARRAKDFREGRVADTETAGIGAEGRHHRALAVAGKAPPFDRAAARRRPAPWGADGRRFRRMPRSAHGETRSVRLRLRSPPRRRDRTAGPGRDCPKSRSSRAVPASPSTRRGRAPTAVHGHCGHENCRRARSPFSGRAARSRPPAGSASPRYRRAAAARRARRSWNPFPGAGRIPRAGVAPARTARRRDRRANMPRPKRDRCHGRSTVSRRRCKHILIVVSR